MRNCGDNRIAGENRGDCSILMFIIVILLLFYQ